MTHSFPTRRSSDLCAQLLDHFRGTASGARQIEIGTAIDPTHEQFARRHLWPDVVTLRDAVEPCVDTSHQEHLGGVVADGQRIRSEEHTSELQSLMRISYAVFCLKKKKNKQNTKQTRTKTVTVKDDDANIT